eukprot:TRINITY_DN26497_c0_g2_i1.p1 TRINITY_DN26497_c0_g2~~TRINITY_DN26497_c0_g2_i1.p1  ORF type:complete len:628 (+),score=77.16 TRINITY_DN26497_c0_g2_i1:33-1886(+)
MDDAEDQDKSPWSHEESVQVREFGTEVTQQLTIVNPVGPEEIQHRNTVKSDVGRFGRVASGWRFLYAQTTSLSSVASAWRPTIRRCAQSLYIGEATEVAQRASDVRNRTRWRVSGVCMTLALCLLTPYFILHDEGNSWSKSATVLTLVVGVIFLLLATLPHDRRLVRVVAVVIVLVMGREIISLVTHTLETYQNQSDVTRVLLTALEGIQTLQLTWMILWISAGIVRSYPRQLLERLWWMAAAWFLCSPFFTCIPHLATAKYSGMDEMMLLVVDCLVLFLGSGFCFHKDCRVVTQSLLASRGNSTASALAVAAMLGRGSTDEILREASQTFRSVSCDKIKIEHFTDNRPDPTLRDLTQPALIGNVDGFLSHSWSDAAEAKWDAIQNWRAQFKNSHNGREPTLWIDKFCIDQRNIDASLRCLPVFLSSCRQLVIAFGPTYLQRLWCVIEIFVFLEIGSSPRRVALLGDPLFDRIESFDAYKTQCYLESDKERLLSIIEFSFGTVDGFSDAVKKVLNMKRESIRTVQSVRYNASRSSALADSLMSTTSELTQTEEEQEEEEKEEEEEEEEDVAGGEKNQVDSLTNVVNITLQFPEIESKKQSIDYRDEDDEAVESTFSI